jgi:hypothetical protein
MSISTSINNIILEFDKWDSILSFEKNPTFNQEFLDRSWNFFTNKASTPELKSLPSLYGDSDNMFINYPSQMGIIPPKGRLISQPRVLSKKNRWEFFPILSIEDDEKDDEKENKRRNKTKKPLIKSHTDIPKVKAGKITFSKKVTRVNQPSQKCGQIRYKPMSRF